jgi:hypothetical protein
MSSIEKQLYDVSNDAWRALLEKEDRENLPKMMERFLDDQRFTAEWFRKQLTDRDSTGADSVIGYIAEGKMEENPRAAMIARREYDAFLIANGAPDAAGVDAFLILFYSYLGKKWKEAGIET